MLTVSFTGAQSTGKTTLVDILSKKYDLPKITNLTRTIPKQLRGTAHGQELILDVYVEVLCGLKGKSYICDRTIYDVCAYSLVADAWTMEECGDTLKQYQEMQAYPQYLFYLPIEFPMVQDGERPDEDNRKKMDFHLTNLLDKFAPKFWTITGRVKDRVSQIDKIIGR